jgi:hypothetical protein
MKRNHMLQSILLAATTCALSQVQAQVFTFTDGNLILGFQAGGGQGSTQNVFVDLGSPTTLRDNPNPGTIKSIGTVLGSVYGPDWYTRTDLWFGVVANLNQQPNSGFGSRQPVNGDPSRTFYVSQAAAAPGTGVLYAQNQFTSDALGIGGGALSGMERVLLPTEAGTGWNFTNGDPLDDGVPLVSGAGVLSLTTTQHATAWNNGWTTWNPLGGGAFNTFNGGIQQNFGKATSSTYVDIQRILSTNTGASPTGVVGGGQYITTIAISSSGVVSASTPAPASAFTAWIGGTFAGGSVAAPDQDPLDDPDNDGIENALEFVLNGDPTVNNQSILPVLNASGTDFVFSFTRRADSAGEVAQVFEYSADLVDWTTNAPVTIPTTTGTSGFATVGASTGVAPNQVQAVTVTIPKGSNTKLFGRLRAVK